ncbi:class 2 aldolase adducin domain containing protein [Grosmannia clavigera kw1407]|uniref:Class 2 aldolase adducin domain containing protein n=1 Tax=Grosmannia clavigera (strain kw1407 / UAMH 11150) TaxID=655863 RepID=F0XMT1_GROCL|nr:class 2 aldolase adducin domain containing protein [Grosmannia clavigera kw1407]EFX01402.1 class 2 aldolase adducin domain containing protein [Grosmannia clavigera kw1407]
MAPSATSTATVTAAQQPKMSLATEDEALAAMAHRGKALPGIPVFATHAETRQWQLEHMAAAFRVFAREGYSEGISGHISVRDPEHADRFWINPLGVHFGMMRASDMICVDLAGEVVGGNTAGSINAAGFSIHSSVHRARPDIHAICHTHSVHGRAYSAFGRPLEMINQDVCYFYRAHAVYSQYGGIANDASEGERIAQSLGAHNKAAILLNHGLLTTGRTVDEAAFLFCLMERSCRVQMLADAAGLPKTIVSDDEAAYNFRMASTPDCLYVEFQPEYKYEEFRSDDFKR